MKISSVILLLVICFNIADFSLGYEFDVSKSEIHGLFNIKLGKVKKDNKAYKEMTKILETLIKNDLCRANPGFEKEHGKWLIKLYYTMKSFIQKYPFSQSALTAKLLIADIAGKLWSHWSLCRIENRLFFLNERKSILEEIRNNYPKTWQGKFCKYKLITNLYYVNRYLEDEPKILREYLRQAIKLLENESKLAYEIDKIRDKELTAFNFIRGVSDYKAPFASKYHFDLAWFYKKIGQYSKAEAQYQILINNFSEIKDSFLARSGLSNIRKLKQKKDK